MPAPLLMLGAAFLFATMALVIKVASSRYGAGEIVLYRCAVGLLTIPLLMRWRGDSLRTPVPLAHLWRGVVGIAALLLWVVAIAGLPLGTATTLNYMSAIWMAAIVVCASLLRGRRDIDPRVVAAVLVGFVGVALVLRPTAERQHLGHGLAGLASGVLAALAYLQIMRLGRAGEPESRVVFYFSLCGVVAGAALGVVEGFHAVDLRGAAELAAIGLLATAAQLMLTRAYAIGHPLSNAALQYTAIVFSAIYGALVFGERIAASALAGIALIAGAGIAATVLRGKLG